MIKEIIRYLLEDEDEGISDWKELASFSDREAWPDSYAGETYLYDANGNVQRKSRNLAGIRNYVRNMPVTGIYIQRLPKHEGGIRVEFHNNWYWVGRFASYGVLTNALRNWRNLYGANLYVDGNLAGKVDYRNPALLAESEEDEEGAYKDLMGFTDPNDEIASMETIKAANRDFFNRANTRFFGTKKIYKYGNFIVLKNVKDWNNMTRTEYVIYEFRYTDDSPDGTLLWRGDSHDLDDAKDQIKARDFGTALQRAERRMGMR